MRATGTLEPNPERAGRSLHSMGTRPNTEIDRGHTAGRATRRLALALMVTAVIAAGCSSSSTTAPEDESTTTSTIDAKALEVPTHVDPAVPITAEVGR